MTCSWALEFTYLVHCPYRHSEMSCWWANVTSLPAQWPSAVTCRSNPLIWSEAHPKGATPHHSPRSHQLHLGLSTATNQAQWVLTPWLLLVCPGSSPSSEFPQVLRSRATSATLSGQLFEPSPLIQNPGRSDLLSLDIFVLVEVGGDFPVGPMVKNLSFSAGDMGSIPRLGAWIPPATGQLCQCAATLGESVGYKERSHMMQLRRNTVK